MYKNLTKSQFLGKTIQYLPECHSTNEVLSKMISHQEAIEGMVVITDFQTKGRGQRGNIWISEDGKNLLFSVYLKPIFLRASDGYLLNIVVGLAVRNAMIEVLPEKEILLKWPNDVYVAEKKIAGILIETDLTSVTIDNAIVGVGLNVNQSHFPLSKATSLLIEAGRLSSLEIILEKILVHLERYYSLLKAKESGRILQEYHYCMMWKGEPRTYQSNGQEFDAVLLGVDQTGNLVLNCNGIKRTFRTKEVVFIG